MMKLIDRVNQDITEAMRDHQPARLSALRMLKTALVNRRIERGHELDESEAQQVVSTLVKQRREAAAQFSGAGRQELAAKEEAEVAMLEAYLPPAASEEEIERAVDQAIAETGASSPRDLGRVMKAVMPRLGGRTVDGRIISDLVRRKLGG
jgi:uncharacterized protein